MKAVRIFYQVLKDLNSKNFLDHKKETILMLLKSMCSYFFNLKIMFPCSHLNVIFPGKGGR